MGIIGLSSYSPPHPTRSLGKRRKLPQRGPVPGRAPPENDFRHFRALKASGLFSTTVT